VPECDDKAAPFTARVSRLTVGPLLHMHYQEITPCRVRRGAREIARYPRQACSIYREASAGAWFERAGQEFTTKTGDIVIADLDLPFQTRSLAQAYSHDVWLVPKLALTPYLPASGRPMLQRLAAEPGTARLLGAYLDVLGQEAASMSPATLDRVTDNLCRLIGVACGMAAGEQVDAVREARLAQAKRYVESHLADPHLSPAGVAAALGISLRSLHIAFEPTGSSVARYILQRRLQECRSMLLNDRKRSITDIAFAWGFNTLSGFYRAFQAAYGASPGDLRAASRHPPLN